MSKPYDPRPHPGSWAANRARVRRGWTAPFQFLEWLTALAAYYLSHWSLLEVLEYAGRFTVLVAVIIYFLEAPDRRKQKHYQAWQVINSAAGKGGNGGRKDALEELNDDKVSLVAVELDRAFLQGLRLPGGDLHFASMQSCDLRDCNLRRANLAGAALRGSNLRNADLRDMRAAGADLSGCDLAGARLAGADLTRADLSGSDMEHAEWNGIAAIAGSNVHGIDNPPDGFIAWAVQHGAVDAAGDRPPGSRPSPTTNP